MHKNQGPVYYPQYLKLDQFLDCQIPMSRVHATQADPEVHEEMLFIVVHQAYELWFKQMIHDLDSVLDIFRQPEISDQDLGTIVQRLDRILKIQNLIGGHLDILETMTPMDFLEFRNLLIPASGFQSTQFREIEIKLGLKTNDRVSVDREFFLGRLSEKDRDRLLKIEEGTSLIKLVEKWLERTPFTQMGTFNFWDEYKIKVNEMLAEDEKTIKSNLAHLDEAGQKAQLENLRITRETFDSLFNKDVHESLIQGGQRKLSQKALLNGLFILLYRHEPLLSWPFKMISLMMDLDESMTTWRQRHALMAQRMLGSKIGTGGSSGHQYLKRAAENNRVFLDFFNLSTYLLPTSRLPNLPAAVLEKLRFKS